MLRQEQEIAHYNRAKAELNRAIGAGASRDEVLALWEKSNDRLRRMGIKLLALPE